MTMATTINLFGGHATHQCDSCGALESRVVTDSHTGLDFCFMCASGHGAEGGLFWRVTQSPDEDGGDNLLEAMREIGMDTERVEAVLGIKTV